MISSTFQNVKKCSSTILRFKIYFHSKNGTNGTDIIGCRTVAASNSNSGSSKSKQNPPALRDETSVKRKLQVDKKSSQSEIAKSPPTLTAAVAVNTTPKMSSTSTTTKKAEAKEVKAVVQAKNEIFTTATTTEDEDDDDDSDGDNPPSQKKLKIDLENHDTIKVKVTANDVKKVEKSVVNNKKVEKNADIKLKVTANDVKKFEKLAGNSNNPIVKSEKKPEMVSVPSSVVKKEEAVMDQKKPIQKLVIDQNKKPIQNKVIDQKKPIQTSGINGTTTNNSVKSTNNSPKSSPNIQQQNQQELVVKPKLTNGSAGSKSRDGNKKLYDIVNNLSKKQASLNNSPNQQASVNKDSSIGKFKPKSPKIVKQVRAN